MVDGPNGRWRYGYDPFGRRIFKASAGRSEDFLWDGDVVARAGEVDWFFEPDSLRPMARVEHGQLAYVVNDHLGTPKEVMAERGALIWAADHDTWGTLRLGRRAAGSDLIEQGDYWIEPVSLSGADTPAFASPLEANFCPIRFQGQWEDAETGLFYNRFRYYEPLAGQYASSDPIRVRGNGSLHRYATSPLILSDPFGLVPCRCCAWGQFSGEIGNSLFTPDDPAALGLKPGATIPFNDGIPDFSQYTVPIGSTPGVFEVPGLTGNHRADRALAVSAIAKNNGWTVAKAEKELLRMGGGIDKLRLHHVGGNTMQIVPYELHRLPHYGGAAELRGNC